MVLVGWIHTPQLKVMKKRKLCILPEDCENDASWRSHGTATRESRGLLIMQNACSHRSPLPKARLLSTTTGPAGKNPLLTTSASTDCSAGESFHQTLFTCPQRGAITEELPPRCQGSAPRGTGSCSSPAAPHAHCGQIPPNPARKPGTETWSADVYNHVYNHASLLHYYHFFFLKPILISKWRKALPASLENESMRSIALLSSSSFPPDLAPQVSAWPADTTSFAGLKPSRSRRLPAHEHQPPRSQQQPVMGTEMQQRAHACAGPGRKALKRE